MENQDIINGSKLIANYLGWVYIPFNELNRFLRPGWYCPAPNSKMIFTPKQGYPEQVGNIWYKYICRNHVDLRFYNSFDALAPVVEKIEKENFHIMLGTGGISIMDMSEFEYIEPFYDKKLTWIQNSFKGIVETIKYINENKIIKNS